MFPIESQGIIIGSIDLSHPLSDYGISPIEGVYIYHLLHSVDPLESKGN